MLTRVQLEKSSDLLLSSSSRFGEVRILGFLCRYSFDDITFQRRCSVMFLLTFPQVPCQRGFIHLYLIFEKTNMVAKEVKTSFCISSQMDNLLLREKYPEKTRKNSAFDHFSRSLLFFYSCMAASDGCWNQSVSSCVI